MTFNPAAPRKTATDSKVNTRDLDYVWAAIEEAFEEDWRVEADGTLVFELTEERLEALCANEDDFQEWFEYREYRESDTGAWVTVNVPYRVLGFYRIKGVYDASQYLIDGERTYYFEQA